MVCIPCIVIPVLLYIWHRFIQPIVLKFWNPWKQVEADKNPSSNKTKIAADGDCTTTKSNTVISDEKSIDKQTNGEVNTNQVKNKSE